MTTVLPSSDNLRQADLASLMAVLGEQRARAFDVVLYGHQINVSGGIFELTGLDGVPTGDGVLDVNGLYSPTLVANEGIASKLDVNLRDLRRFHATRPDIYEAVVGGHLRRNDLYPCPTADKKYLLRLFRSDDSPTGLLRAFLSDSYRAIDNVDVLMAALAGIQQAGIKDPIIEADLTERRMIVRVTAPEIAVYADKLLENYRSPFDGTDVSMGWTPSRVQQAARREGMEIDGGSKLVFAGFVLTNSEVGGGRFAITPQIRIQACGNGLTFTAEATAKTHLGGKLDQGIVKWSAETEEANLALITKQAADAVKTYLDIDYVTKKVAALEQAATEPVNDAPTVIAHVSKKLAFNDAQQQLILAHFYKGAQPTVFGVTQAITSAAQVIRDGDTALDMENAAVSAIQHAREGVKLAAAAAK